MKPSRYPTLGVTLLLLTGSSNLFKPSSRSSLLLVEAVIPSAGLRISDGGLAYASPAWFGIPIPEEGDAEFLPLRVPSGDADGCDNVTVEDIPEEGGGFVLVLERGNCFFDVKALNAQEAGAKGVVVMNTVKGIYQVWFLRCSPCVMQCSGSTATAVLYSTRSV